MGATLRASPEASPTDSRMMRPAYRPGTTLTERTKVPPVQPVWGQAEGSATGIDVGSVPGREGSRALGSGSDPVHHRGGTPARQGRMPAAGGSSRPGTTGQPAPAPHAHPAAPARSNLHPQVPQVPQDLAPSSLHQADRPAPAPSSPHLIGQAAPATESRLARPFPPVQVDPAALGSAPGLRRGPVDPAPPVQGRGQTGFSRRPGAVTGASGRRLRAC